MATTGMALGGLILGSAAIGLTIVKELTGRRHRPSAASGERWPGGLERWRAERDRVVAELCDRWAAELDAEYWRGYEACSQDDPRGQQLTTVDAGGLHPGLH